MRMLRCLTGRHDWTVSTMGESGGYVRCVACGAYRRVGCMELRDIYNAGGWGRPEPINANRPDQHTAAHTRDETR